MKFLELTKLPERERVIVNVNHIELIMPEKYVTIIQLAGQCSFKVFEDFDHIKDALADKSSIYCIYGRD